MKRNIKIFIPDPDASVRGIIQLPAAPKCVLVFAHGAGAGMEHPFMQKVSDALESHNIGTLRFNFLYMDQGGGRPDPPKTAYAILRSAVGRAKEYATPYDVPVVGGGKSFGGRMFSQLMASGDPPAIRALVFLGFPLHAPGKPGTDRAKHLEAVQVPMLFLQGTRDTLADSGLISGVTKGLRRATLRVIEGADHGFHVLKRSGKTDDEIIELLARETATWLARKLG